MHEKPDAMLQHVSNYTGAQYPTLAEHYGEKHSSGVLSACLLVAALAAVATILSGCNMMG